MQEYFPVITNIGQPLISYETPRRVKNTPNRDQTIILYHAKLHGRNLWTRRTRNIFVFGRQTYTGT